jgi:hypothetical protein
MTKGHSYFVLLEELKLPGCPICSLVIKDGQSYLDQLLYENVLDVPTRLNLMDSFGFCNRHAWQIPKLPLFALPQWASQFLPQICYGNSISWLKV